MGGVKIGHPRKPTSIHKEAEHQLPRTEEEEEEEDPAAQLVHQKRKRSESGSSHSEARVSRGPSGGSTPEAPRNLAGGAGGISISPSPPRATGDTSAPRTVERRERQGRLGGILHQCRRRARLLHQHQRRSICHLHRELSSTLKRRRDLRWRIGPFTRPSSDPLATSGERDSTIDPHCRDLGIILVWG